MYDLFYIDSRICAAFLSGMFGGPQEMIINLYKENLTPEQISKCSGQSLNFVYQVLVDYENKTEKFIRK